MAGSYTLDSVSSHALGVQAAWFRWAITQALKPSHSLSIPYPLPLELCPYLQHVTLA
jgi:hypothetical protein